MKNYHLMITISLPVVQFCQIVRLWYTWKILNFIFITKVWNEEWMNRNNSVTNAFYLLLWSDAVTTEWMCTSEVVVRTRVLLTIYADLLFVNENFWLLLKLAVRCRCSYFNVLDGMYLIYIHAFQQETACIRFGLTLASNLSALLVSIFVHSSRLITVSCWSTRLYNREKRPRRCFVTINDYGLTNRR